MNHKAVLVPEGTFRSPLIRIIAILCALAAGCAFIGSLSLFLPGYFLMYQVSPDSITTADARGTWTILHCGFLIFGYLCSLLMAASLLQAVRSRVQEGMDLLGRGLRALRVVFTATTAVAVVLFIINFIRYAIGMLSLNGGIIVFVPGALAELFMGAQAWFLFVLLRRFLDGFSNAAASIARTITTGTLRSPAISMLPAVGFLILAGANLMLFINRIIAFSAWWNTEYRTAFTILLIFPAIMFLLMSAADVLLFLYLRKYKMTSEYLLYKGTPVEEAENV